MSHLLELHNTRSRFSRCRRFRSTFLIATHGILFAVMLTNKVCLEL